MLPTALLTVPTSLPLLGELEEIFLESLDFSSPVAVLMTRGFLDRRPAAAPGSSSEPPAPPLRMEPTLLAALAQEMAGLTVDTASPSAYIDDSHQAASSGSPPREPRYLNYYQLNRRVEIEVVGTRAN